MKQDRFVYVCTNCMNAATESKTMYKGLVNLQIEPLPAARIVYLRHFCFTCKAEEMVVVRDGYDLKDKESFKKHLDKRHKTERLKA
jgi:hypothetical protein